MSFIECSDHMKDQWSKPKVRFKHIEKLAIILNFKPINRIDALNQNIRI